MRTLFFLVATSLSLLVGCTRPPEAPVVATNETSSTEIPTPISEPSAPAVPKLRVVGTEPFWGIDGDGNRLHFTTMEDQTGRWLEAEFDAMDDGRWQWAGQTDAGKFVLDVARGECSDGMSDRRYAYTANFTIDQVEYRGCADDPAKFSGEGEEP